MHSTISSGRELSKRRNSPVEGFSTPNVLACSACLGSILKQFSTNCLYLAEEVPFNILSPP